MSTRPAGSRPHIVLLGSLDQPDSRTPRNPKFFRLSGEGSLGLQDQESGPRSWPPQRAFKRYAGEMPATIYSLGGMLAQTQNTCPRSPTGHLPAKGEASCSRAGRPQRSRESQRLVWNPTAPEPQSPGSQMMAEGTMAPTQGHSVEGQGHWDRDTSSDCQDRVGRTGQWDSVLEQASWLGREESSLPAGSCLSLGGDGRLVAKEWRKQIVLSAVW